jgi:hypothetical protein
MKDEFDTSVIRVQDKSCFSGYRLRAIGINSKIAAPEVGSVVSNANNRSIRPCWQIKRGRSIEQVNPVSDSRDSSTVAVNDC